MASADDQDAKRRDEAVRAQMRADLGRARLDNLPLDRRPRNVPTWTPTVDKNSTNAVPVEFKKSLIGAWATTIDDNEAREELRSHPTGTILTRPWDRSDKPRALPVFSKKRDIAPEMQDCVVIENTERPQAGETPEVWELCSGMCLLVSDTQAPCQKVHFALILQRDNAVLRFEDNKNQMRNIDLEGLSEPKANGVDFAVEWDHPEYQNIVLRFATAQHAAALCKYINDVLDHIDRIKLVNMGVTNTSNNGGETAPGLLTANHQVQAQAQAQAQTQTQGTLVDDSDKLTLPLESKLFNKNAASDRLGVLIDLDMDGASDRVRKKFATVMSQALKPLFKAVNELSALLKNIPEADKSLAMAGVHEAMNHGWRAQDWVYSASDATLLNAAVQGMIQYKNALDFVSEGFNTNPLIDKGLGHEATRLVYHPEVLESLRDHAVDITNRMKSLVFPKPGSSSAGGKIGSKTGFAKHSTPVDMTASKIFLRLPTDGQCHGSNGGPSRAPNLSIDHDASNAEVTQREQVETEQATVHEVTTVPEVTTAPAVTAGTDDNSGGVNAATVSSPGAPAPAQARPRMSRTAQLLAEGKGLASSRWASRES
ncbi:hypothetical protein N3K66_005167 [Trichothecium roseum]|uniref:Uncharacterized protein n=1 Tax=Trichothecium roseum TaxID=47278 RepID=A0ACC0V4Q1_9HYPO|nr:hypothetical protein N3K66_005167 [Trichothecium roseum]